MLLGPQNKHLKGLLRLGRFRVQSSIGSRPWLLVFTRRPSCWSWPLSRSCSIATAGNTMLSSAFLSAGATVSKPRVSSVFS